MSHPWLYRYALLVAAAILYVLVTGAAVTNQLALASPDAASLAVAQVDEAALALLSTHRVAAEAATVLVLLLAAWITFAGKRGKVMQLAWLAVAVAVAAALAGSPGAPLSSGIGTSHAFLGPMLFALLVAVATFLWRGWQKPPVQIEDKGWPSLKGLARATVVLLILQIALGAGFRHNVSGILWHILGAFLVVLIGLGMTVFVTQTPGCKTLHPAVITLAVLLGVQVTLGLILISVTQPANHPALVLFSTAAHVLTSSAILAGSVVSAMLVWRIVKRPEDKDASLS